MGCQTLHSWPGAGRRYQWWCDHLHYLPWWTQGCRLPSRCCRSCSWLRRPCCLRKREAEPYTVGQVLAGHTAGGVITSTTYAGGLTVPGLPLAHHYPVVYGKREAEPQFFQFNNLGAFATTNPVHAVAATPAGLTHSSNV